ncbi:MAG: copper transport protein [Rubrobacteraceae bacterium]|nr:copper transport protein [Rubrobacteraceae bacterium]
MKPSVRRASTLGLMVVLGSVDILPLSSAYAQEVQHGDHSAHTPVDLQGLAVGIAHGATLGAVVFLTGLVMFAALVWLPASEEEDTDQEKDVNLFCRWMWMLVGMLTVAGVVEIPLYAVRASGENLSPGLLVEALFATRVGQLWIERLALGILTAAAATYAAQRLRRPAYWWVAIVVAMAMLITITQQSHAAAEGGLLPFAADWLHLMAGSLWMGGLLGFPLLLIGPLRVMPAERRAKLLGSVVPRFSKVAAMAIMSLILTGLVAILLHVPSLSALFDTAYGRALTMKFGLLVLMLPIGGLNLIDRGQGPFGRMVSAELILAVGVFVATGFLTNLPPANVEIAGANDATSPGHVSQPAPTLREPPMPNAP